MYEINCLIGKCRNFQRFLLMESQRMKNENCGVKPALHPTLVALFIVLSSDSPNLSEIGRNYPKCQKHKDYDPNAQFPEDLSPFLPPSEDHWWEHLGKSS
jgi:hypothetical protein